MRTMRGFVSVLFVCPMCGGSKWGTNGSITGVCRGEADGLTRCPFTWSRRYDWRFFIREDSGARFVSAEAFEEFGCASALPPPTLAEVLQELMAEVMHRPPTVGVVQMWSREQQRRALAWASAEVLAEDNPRRRRLERPRFIEEGSATA